MKTLLGVLVLSIFNLSGLTVGDDLPCVAKWSDIGPGYVCVCNSTYCDTVNTPDELDKGQYYLYRTSNSTPGFTRSTGHFTEDVELGVDTSEIVFTIDSTIEYQEIVGFGGAITDSAGLAINMLSEDAKVKLVESYFGPSGIEYTMLRIPIGNTDFSIRLYTLDDVPNDLELEHFSLQEEDYTLRLPFIKKAMSVSKRDIKMMACSWVAPDWMKINNTVTSGYIKKDNLDVWARYHLRFLEEYQKEGLNIWALSGGNEVMMLIIVSQYQGMLNFTLEYATTQKAWLRDHLKPQLLSSNFSDVKFIALEDERLFATYWMERFANDPAAYAAMDAIALHTYTDRFLPLSVLDNLHQSYPEKLIMYTETSINTGTIPVKLGSWDRAETYLSSIFENLNHWVVTYLDWNLALDVNGGPSLSYGIDSPIIVNENSGEFYKQPMFYALGHFSKFVQPGAKRLEVSSSQSDEPRNKKASKHFDKDVLREIITSGNFRSLSALDPKYGSVQCIAFTNPDNSRAVLVFNTNDEAASVRIVDSMVGNISLTVEEHSINTFLYWP